MAVLIVRGPLNVTGGPGVEVIRSPALEIVSQGQNNPTILSEESIMVQEPGGSRMISLKALKERISKEGL